MQAARNTTSERQRWSFQSHPLRMDMQILFLAALVIFIVTVFIGLLNGQRIFNLPTNVLLTHVHAGTIGWITLSVFALSLWLFGPDSSRATTNWYIRWSSVAAAVFVPLYILAFLSDIAVARAALGVPIVLVMVAFFGWIIARSRKVRLGVPQIALLAALLTLCLGGLLGVLIQFEFAIPKSFLPNGAFGAHPAALVSGYLILIGVALSEWQLKPASNQLSRLAIAQIILFFLAGLVLGCALLFTINPLFGLNTLLLVIAAVIYVIRFAPVAGRINWLERNSTRLFMLSGVFIVIEIILTVYSTVNIISGAFPNGNIPSNVLITLDHATFIGVMTNALFGLLHEVTNERGSFWPWADHVIFWGTNIGLVGFLIALLSNVRDLERVFTPIMGLSILLAIVVYIVRFNTKYVAVAIVASQTNEQL